jgi:hypothetical protein
MHSRHKVLPTVSFGHESDVQGVNTTASNCQPEISVHKSSEVSMMQYTVEEGVFVVEYYYVPLLFFKGGVWRVVPSAEWSGTGRAAALPFVGESENGRLSQPRSLPSTVKVQCER